MIVCIFLICAITHACFVYSMDEQQEKKTLIIFQKKELEKKASIKLLKKEEYQKIVRTFYLSLESIESFPDEPLELLEKYPELTIVPCAFAHTTSFILLLNTLKKNNPDEESLIHYLKVGEKIIAHAIQINKKYELDGESSQELIEQTENILGINSREARLFYKIIEESSDLEYPKNFFDLFDTLNVKKNPVHFFNAFSESKQLKLLTFLKKYPLWTEKNDENNNTTLMLAIKNFSDCTSDFILIEFLLQRMAKNLFKKNNDGENPFDAANLFIEHKEKLYEFIRSTLEKMIPNKQLSLEFFKIFSKSDYAKAVELLKENPELCFVKCAKNKRITWYLEKTKRSELITTVQSDFDELNKIVRIFIPIKTVHHNFFTTLRRNSFVTFENLKMNRYSVSLNNNGERNEHQKNNFSSSFTFGETEKKE